VVYATGPVISGGQQPRVLRETVLVDDLAGAFGPGYRFLRATVEVVPTGIWPLSSIGITGTSLTQGIEQKLPFLVTHRDELRRIISNMPPRFQPHFHLFLRS